MGFSGAVEKRQTAMAFTLGIASLVAVFISLLALSDIYRGGSDLRSEWITLRVCFAVIFTFQVFALITFWGMIRKKTATDRGRHE
jgi:uncharacterized membrane protein YozB (DUF420 family)